MPADAQHPPAIASNCLDSVHWRRFMSPKRPSSISQPLSPGSTPSSSGSSEPPTKRQRTTSPPSSYPIKLHILEAKLDATKLADLVSLADSHSHRKRKRSVTENEKAAERDPFELQLCWNAREADVIVTAVQMRKRFERHLDWSSAVSEVICICSMFAQGSAHRGRKLS